MDEITRDGIIQRKEESERITFGKLIKFAKNGGKQMPPSERISAVKKALENALKYAKTDSDLLEIEEIKNSLEG